MIRRLMSFASVERHRRRRGRLSLLAAAAAFPLLAHAAPSACDAVAGNLIANCGFERGAVAAGSLGFTSQYTYTSNLLPAGTFYVGANPDTYNGYFGTPTATPNSGSFEMIINGDSSANARVWQETGISVVPNTDYYFSVAAATVNPSSPAILNFSINGVQLGTSFTLTTTPGPFSTFYAMWSSGATTSATIALIDQNTASGGNDFALDDFVFSTTQPGSGTPVTPIVPVSPVPEPEQMPLVAGGLVLLAIAVRRSRRQGRDGDRGG